MVESYLALSRRDRLEALGVAATASGRPVHLLEKDIWVVWSLQGLFTSTLGACPNSGCSILSESDSSLGYEQVFSPLEYRSDAASAAERAGFRAEGPRLAVYRWAGAREPRSQGDYR